MDEPALLIRTVTSPVAWAAAATEAGSVMSSAIGFGARQVDLAGIAGAGVDGGTAAEQLGSQRPAKPPARPGDEDGAGRQVHGKLLMK